MLYGESPLAWGIASIFSRLPEAHPRHDLLWCVTTFSTLDVLAPCYAGFAPLAWRSGRHAGGVTPGWGLWGGGFPSNLRDGWILEALGVERNIRMLYLVLQSDRT